MTAMLYLQMKTGNHHGKRRRHDDAGRRNWDTDKHRNDNSKDKDKDRTNNNRDKDRSGSRDHVRNNQRGTDINRERGRNEDQVSMKDSAPHWEPVPGSASQGIRILTLGKLPFARYHKFIVLKQFFENLLYVFLVSISRYSF